MNLHDLSHEQRKIIITMEKSGVPVHYPVKAEHAVWIDEPCFEIGGFYHHSLVDLVPDDKCLFIAYTRHKEVYKINNLNDLIDLYLKCKDYVSSWEPDEAELGWEKILTERD